jgi:hypothetical protein
VAVLGAIDWICAIESVPENRKNKRILPVREARRRDNQGIIIKLITD